LLVPAIYVEWDARVGRHFDFEGVEDGGESESEGARMDKLGRRVVRAYRKKLKHAIDMFNMN
jgi:hypothetical protein